MKLNFLSYKFYKILDIFSLYHLIVIFVNFEKCFLQKIWDFYICFSIFRWATILKIIIGGQGSRVKGQGSRVKGQGHSKSGFIAYLDLKSVSLDSLTQKTYTLIPVLTLKIYMCIFGSHFPKNPQYLVNGDSDQKNAANRKDEKFNFLCAMRKKIKVSSTNIV